MKFSVKPPGPTYLMASPPLSGAQQTVLAGEEEAERPLRCQATGADAEHDIN
jgi:hypothetical protein